ncbi:hypothetical protein ACN28S_26290 [Cystobacter fuscus]
MFKIQSHQMKSFEEAILRRFEDEMVVHSKEFTPWLCEVIGEEQLRVALRQAIARAGSYGFTYRGPIRLYVELMLLCGSAFDTDPQYAAVGECLRASGDQMQRAEHIYQKAGDYLDKISGYGMRNMHKALDALSVLTQMPMTYSPREFTTIMLHEVHRVFPQKADYIGDEQLTALIYEGRAEAQKYGYHTSRGEALVVMLMFAFGHGCTNDPIYPWIARVLRDERSLGPAAHAERLEQKRSLGSVTSLQSPAKERKRERRSTKANPSEFEKWWDFPDLHHTGMQLQGNSQNR